MLKKIIITTIITLIILMLSSPVVKAQQDASLGSAVSVSVTEKGVKNGDIISSTLNGYKRTVTDYDPFVYGVVNDKPAIYLQDRTLPNAKAIITSGKTIVRVSTVNGPIKHGDYITSSTIPGVGQKATDNGYVLGTAEEDYTDSNAQKIGTILITLHPHFAQLTNNLSRNILNGVRMGMTAALQTPLGALRYIISAIIALLSFYFGFKYLGSASRSGVEAVGRNPLASKVIIFSVIINVTVTISIMFLGVALAYVILVL